MFVTALRRSEWTALPHPPFVMDDTIGELLETQEHFSPSKQRCADCLLAAGKYGLAGLPLAYKVKFGWCMLRYKMPLRTAWPFTANMWATGAAKPPAGGSMPYRTATWCAA